jgi:phenylacetate-CoA ligase
MWKPQLEKLPRDQLLERQLKLFRKQMHYVIEESPFYGRKFAGIHPGDVKTLEDAGKIPFATKQDLLKSQQEHPSFGDFPCIKPSKATRVFQTSGTTGTPLKIPLSKKDWFENYFNQFSYFLYGCGIRPDDVAFFPSFTDFSLHGGVCRQLWNSMR